MQWPVRHWPRLLAPLRHYLNNKPRQLLKNKAPIELALGIPREDPLSLVIDADVKLERALKELTRTGSAADDLRKLEVELTRSRADAINVAERVRTEQRRRVDKVDDDKFNVPACSAESDILCMYARRRAGVRVNDHIPNRDRVRKNALTPPPLTRFRWHEPVLGHVDSRRRTVLGARRPRQVQDRKVFGCE